MNLEAESRQDIARVLMRVLIRFVNVCDHLLTVFPRTLKCHGVSQGEANEKCPEAELPNRIRDR